MSEEQRDPAAGNACVEMEGRGEMIKAIDPPELRLELQDRRCDLQELRRRIYRKAKSEKTHRFWGLFVHVTKRQTLGEAYRIAKRNGGAPGIDGQSFEAIEAAGLAGFLEDIRDDLESGRYQPKPNRGVDIPKENGKVRTLQIPCIRDRVVQGALKLILEAVFEADFCPNSYGFRPRRSPHSCWTRSPSAFRTLGSYTSSSRYSRPAGRSGCRKAARSAPWPPIST